MNFVPISPYAGAECFDRLSFPLSLSDVAEIKDAFAKYKVVVFREQSGFSDENHIELTSIFGGLHIEPANNYTDAVGAQITTVSHRKEAGYGSAELFHCDGVFSGTPSQGLCLRVVEHPTSGGDITFSVFSRVWESISPCFQELFKGLTVRYSLLPAVAARKYLRAGDRNPVDVPLVFKHPATGKDSLFFSLIGARDIPELSETEVAFVFELLKEKINYFGNQIRVRYAPGTAVLFDNTAVTHAVSIDYLPELRRVSRVLLKGVKLERAAPAFDSGFPVDFVSTAKKGEEVSQKSQCQYAEALKDK